METTDIQIKKSVNAIRINFFFLGVLIAGWSTRIPEIKSALHLNDAQLGRCLIAVAIGAFASSRFIGRLIQEYGTKKVFYFGTFIFPVGYLTLAYAPSGFFIFLGCFFMALAYQLMDNPLTISTQELEALTDRKYLSGFHGFWSLGTLFAAFFGSFLIGHVKYYYHLTGLALISFAVLALSGRNLADKKVDNKKVKVKFVWKSRMGFIVAAIGFGMLCANSSEFGATDWSALFLRDVMGISGQLYVGAYLLFEIGMVTSRIMGDKYIHEYGPEKVVRVCGIAGSLLWLAGMSAGVALHSVNKPLAYIVVLLGYLGAGLGVGPIFPGLITILGKVEGIDMSVALSRALVIAIVGFAGVPALIGLISNATSLTFGMLLPMALLFCAGLLSRVARMR
jgi:MFS family permease